MFASRMWSASLAATSVTAACISIAATAEAAGPQWNGRYTLVTYASQKNGSSMAKLQPESDFSAQYTLATDCSSGLCVATVVDGPAPSNPTIPQPTRYSWDGSRWVFAYNWQWQCFRGDGVPAEWAPARSQVAYTPAQGGSLSGTWRTDILSGTCRGFVVMPVAAYPA
jgi:opacity protein-like surface antigen